MHAYRFLFLAVTLLTPATQEQTKDLFHAIYQGDATAVGKLLADNPKLANTPNEHGHLPLQAALRGRSIELARILLDAGADLHARERDTGTALHFAAANGPKQAVELLLARGAKVDSHTVHDDFTPLHWAASHGHTDIVGLLLAKGADVNGAYTGEGLKPRWSPLYAAVKNRHAEVVKLLIAKGARVEATDRVFDGSPLSAAAEVRDLALVRLLLAHTKGIPTDGTFRNALQAGDQEMISLLLEKGVDATRPEFLIAATFAGKKDVVELLLAKGARANARERGGASALMAAAQRGHADIVALLLANAADPNGADEKLLTPLHVAGNKAVAKLLVDKGAEVDVGDHANKSPLFRAVQAEKKDVAEFLESQGATHDAYTMAALGRVDTLRKYLVTAALPEVRKVPWHSPLHLAAMYGQIGTARVLLEKGADVNSTEAKQSIVSGVTPLHRAAQRGHKEMVEFLLEKGADLNARMKRRGGFARDRDWTPLQAALDAGQADVARLLLSKKALPTLEGESLRAAMLGAIQAKHAAVMKLLVDLGAPVNDRAPLSNQTALRVAAEARDLELVKLLLAKGADAKAGEYDGWTPLRWAAKSNHLKIAEALLAAGVDRNDNSPLCEAAAQGNQPMVELLLAKGADVNGYWGLRDTPLSCATRAGKVEIVRFLLGKGASVRKSHGLLHEAALYGRRDVAEILLANGADVNEALAQGFGLIDAAFAKQPEVRDFFTEKDLNKLRKTPGIGLAVNPDPSFKFVTGGTPLQASVAARQKAVAELLLDKGAAVNARFPTGAVPLHLAAVLGDAATVRLLIDRGADRNAKDNAGRTPLQVATEKGNRDVARMLRE
jgi:ankyrin repeat protein